MRFGRWGWCVVSPRGTRVTAEGRLELDCAITIRRWHPGYWWLWLRTFLRLVRLHLVART